MKQKRKAQRILVKLEVKYMAHVIKITSATSNISETGMYIRTDRQLPVGSMLDITLELPGSREHHLQGVVKWNLGPRGKAKSGMGIQLIDPPEEYRDYVRSLIP